MSSLNKAELDLLMAIDGSVDEPELNHLYALACAVRTGCIVEIGAWRGRATAALAMASMKHFRVPVYVIDPQEEFIGVYGGRFGPEDRGALFETMVRLKLYSVIRLVNLSSEWLSVNWPHPVHLLWIDGDHSYEGVQRDLRCWLPKVQPPATLVFDDALDSAIGPHRAIEELCADPAWRQGPVVGKTKTLYLMPSSRDCA